MCCREAALMLSCATGILLQSQYHLDPCILNENAKSSLFYIWGLSYRLPVLEQKFIYTASLQPCLGLNRQVQLSQLFYSLPPIIQVLHLMNKMSLPCPFGPVTARPPMVSLYLYLLDRVRQVNGSNCLYDTCKINHLHQENLPSPTWVFDKMQHTDLETLLPEKNLSYLLFS